MAQPGFVNHYAALGLPGVAMREEIYNAYQLHRQQLQEAAAQVDGRRSGGVPRCAQPLPLASEALQALLSTSSKLRVMPAKDGGDAVGGKSRADHKVSNEDKGTADPAGEAAAEYARPSLLLSTWSKPHSLPTGEESAANCEPSASIERDADIWHPLDAETIIERNKLTDAFTILTHPVKKKVYDYLNLIDLQHYEGQRIAQDVHGKAQHRAALERVGDWRGSLLNGNKQGYGYDYDESEFGRVRSLRGISKQERCVVASSVMCGEVIAGFVDGMEL